MNIKQVEWAQSHDWFVCSFKDTERAQDDQWLVTVETDQVDKDGEWSTDRQIFSDVKQLRDWAGY